MLVALGATICLGTVSAQENEEGDIEIIDFDEGLDENLTDFDPAINTDTMMNSTEGESQEATAGSVPMQPTGTPILPALISASMISVGIIAGAKYNL